MGATQPISAAIDRRMPVLIAILEDWAHWTSSLRIDLGYPNRAAGFSTGGGVYDGDESYTEMERQRMQSVDAAVSDLPAADRCAIHRRYLMSVYRFPRDPYEIVLQRAHESLMILLPRKGVDL